MKENVKRIYQALNVGMFIFVEDDFEFEMSKTRILYDFSRMDEVDREELLKIIPNDAKKETLVQYSSRLNEWIDTIRWSDFPSDDIEYIIKDNANIKALYDAVDETLWAEDNGVRFIRYGVGIIVPECMRELFEKVIRINTNYLPTRVYKDYIRETYMSILEDFDKQRIDAMRSAVLVLDNKVGEERVAKQMISDLRQYSKMNSKRIFATIFSTAPCITGESVETSELYIGYTQKSQGLQGVHKNIVYAAINILIQKYKQHYKEIIDNECGILAENPELVDYLYRMAKAEGSSGYEIIQQWISFMMNYDMENSEEFAELIKLSTCVDGYKFENNKHPDIPIQLINAASTENYLNTVNKFCSVVSPGDIFQYNDELYVLVGQDCDYMMGENRRRRSPICELVSAELIPQCSYEKLADDNHYVYINNYIDFEGNIFALKVDYSRRHFISNEILNLCSFNKRGECYIDIKKRLSEEIESIIQPYMIDYYSELQQYFVTVQQVKEKTPDYFNVQSNLNIVLPLISIEDYQVEGNVISYNLKRLSRLRRVACLYLYKMFLEYRGRIPYTTINLMGYSPLSTKVIYLDNSITTTVYVKFSNNRNNNREKECCALAWHIKKEDFVKILKDFGQEISSEEIVGEYVELRGKAPVKISFAKCIVTLTKKMYEQQCFLELQLEDK